MAIEKNNFKVSRSDVEFSMGSRGRESMSSDDDDVLHRPIPMDSEDDDEFDDADSGAGSDDFDLLELGESGSEFCQVGDQSCCIPFELYDLPDLREILSLDVWNECLTEEERFSLTQYLPDMDQETYMHTLKELLEGTNFHFGSPVTKMFQMLKVGLCEPRVALYRQGQNFFLRHHHYHVVRNHHNSMVSDLLQIREAWQKCKGYSIDEKLHVLDIVRSQKSLMGETMEYMQTDYSEKEEFAEGLWGKRSKGRSSINKAGYALPNRMIPPWNSLPRGKLSATESSKSGKQNHRVLKHVGSKAPAKKGVFANVHRHRWGRQGLKSAPSGSRLNLSRLGKASGYDSTAPSWQMRDELEFNDYIEEEAYSMNHPSDRDLPVIGQSHFVRPGKKPRVARGDEHVSESYINMPISSEADCSAYSMKLNVNELSDVEVLTTKRSNVRTSSKYGKKGKHLERPCEDQMIFRRVSSKANRAGFLNRSEPFSGKKAKGQVGFPDASFRYNEWDVRDQKSSLGKGISDGTFKTARISQRELNSRLFHSEKQAKSLMEKIKGISAQEGGPTIASFKASRELSRGEETESDSSDQFDEEEDKNPLMISRLAFPGNCLEDSESSVPKHGLNHKDIKAKKGKKQSAQIVDEIPANYRIVGDFDGHPQLLDTRDHSSKSRQKAKRQQVDHFESSIPHVFEDFNSLNKSNTKRNIKTSKKTSKNGKMQAGQTSTLPLRKASPAERRLKRTLGKDFCPVQPNYLQDYFVEKDENLLEDDHFGESIQNGVPNAVDHDSTLIGCHSVSMKRKAKAGSVDMNAQEYSDHMDSASRHLLDESPPTRKRVKKKVEADAALVPSVIEGELEPKPPKKFTLITPTIHTGFSFSIVHLLSAVRVAMVAPKSENSSEVGKHFDNTDKSTIVMQDKNGEHQSLNRSHEHLDGDKVEFSGQTNVPLLSIQEIVNRVRLNPGDPSILDTQEPLHDLVRGVLKIFSSKTAPLGAKGWKPLVCYEKSTKFWSWIGPIPQSSIDQKAPEAVASPEAWGIPHKMLVKLVDSFATWLKSGQETLQQIGSLPAPPLELMQINLDEKERFRDLRAQKSLSTINPSSEDVRAYFQKEEQLRYSVPDRAFFYTAADGKKSIVAPLRRGGGKPTSKARDHPILKRDRPPHVTILCLVRDAAARLPGSIGTRADVCTLIRDSQYIVEDATDSQVNQVVSGALDRLHYERDPCVQFDGERKLWVYLHREREEEDFEDDGTSSTKKWKRQKKDPAEQGDQGTPTAACPVSEEQAGFDLCSDLNAEPPCADDDKRMDIQYDDTRRNPEDNMDNGKVPEQGGVNKSHPIKWEKLGLDPMQGNKLLCHENSVNEDLDDDTFAGDTDGDSRC